MEAAISIAIFITYLTLLIGGVVAHIRKSYDWFVRFEDAALAVATITLLFNLFANNAIPALFWGLTTVIQFLGVLQARRFRKEWLSWRHREHQLHVCNEDCPSWSAIR